MKQDTALTVLKTGVNVFLTGEPGAGKTYTINRYIMWLRGRGVPVVATASTGIAANHLNGQTIHSWSGVGILDSLTQEDIERIMRKGGSVRRITDTVVLVIDEISMLSGTLLDTLDYLFRTVRVDARAFGGMQVVCVGDFFQLPPVAGDEEVQYAFESKAWERARIRVCYLTEQHRQKDRAFLNVLRSIRNGSAGGEECAFLSRQRSIVYEGKEPTLLYAYNRDVDRDNAVRLADLPGEERMFEMRKTGPEVLTDRLTKGCLSPEVLCLKKDAMVMCTKNNPAYGFFNGTLGIVVGFDTNDFPLVETFDGRMLVVEEAEWSMEDGERRVASVKQVPLRLAWAITIHKSQGSSLDAVKICLSDVFVEGQGYVALSRVRTLGGLQVTGNVNPMALQVSPKVIAWDRMFRTASERLFRWCDQYPVALQRKQQEFLDRIGVSGRKGEKKSTLQITKEMLQEGLSVKEIVDRRGLKRKTILGHVETLAAERDVTADDVLHPLPDG